MESLPKVYGLFGDLSLLAREKRRLILSDRGYDPSLRRPLERMLETTISITNLKILKKSFADPLYRKLILHLPTLSQNFFSFMSILESRKQRAKLSYLFLKDLSQANEMSLDELTKIAQMIEEIHSYSPHWSPKSIQDLFMLEKTMVEDLAKVSFQEDIVFYPEPPFLGDGWIEPIISNEELYKEGRRQHNCVYDYDEKIREGRFYLYHISAKIPCTVSFLKIDEDWYFDQIAGPCNKPADPETYHQLEAWRLRHGILILGDVFRLGKAPTWMLE